MRAVLDIILIILDLYVWLLIASAILSWLIAFNVVNTRNQFVAAVAEFLYRITEPVLAPIRRMLPSLGGLDISPIVVILIIMFIQRVIYLLHLPQRLLIPAGADGRLLDGPLEIFHRGHQRRLARDAAGRPR